MKGTTDARRWQRFWTKVAIPDGDGCWEWQGCISNCGYGSFWLSRVDGSESAHRLSYEFCFGSPPNGLWVLHHCDNRKCVRPEHLYAGTVQDNVRDAMTHGGKRRGPPATECSSGHLYTDASTYYIDQRGYRRCRACLSRTNHENYVRRKAKRVAAERVVL